MEKIRTSRSEWQSGIAKNITFIVTKDCQLACKYCYLVGKNTKERMSWEVAKQAIDYVLDHEDEMKEESVIWDFIGGEPFLEIDLIDKMKKGPDDNPTIGIILCTETDSDVARYSTLAKNDQMFAAKYKLYLPDKEDLRREIERQKELYLMAHPEENDKE